MSKACRNKTLQVWSQNRRDPFLTCIFHDRVLRDHPLCYPFGWSFVLIVWPQSYVCCMLFLSSHVWSIGLREECIYICIFSQVNLVLGLCILQAARYCILFQKLFIENILVLSHILIWYSYSHLSIFLVDVCHFHSEWRLISINNAALWKDARNSLQRTCSWGLTLSGTLQGGTSTDGPSPTGSNG